MIPDVIQAASNASVSVGRLYNFLITPEIENYVNKQTNITPEKPAIEINKGTFSWGSFQLSDVNIKVRKR